MINLEGIPAGLLLFVTARIIPVRTPCCPDLVVELASTSGASPSDAGPRGTAALRQKMALDHANGARLGWLLLPHERAVEIGRAGLPGMAERLENASRLEGGELAEGLALDLEAIWAG